MGKFGEFTAKVIGRIKFGKFAMLLASSKSRTNRLFPFFFVVMMKKRKI